MFEPNIGHERLVCQHRAELQGVHAPTAWDINAVTAFWKGAKLTTVALTEPHQSPVDVDLGLYPVVGGPTKALTLLLGHEYEIVGSRRHRQSLRRHRVPP